MDDESTNMRSVLNKHWFITWFWLVPMLIAVALSGFILGVVGSDREVESLGVFIVKLLPYCFAALGIALFPRRSPVTLRVALAFVSVVPFFTFFVPRQFKLARDGIQAGYEAMPRGAGTSAFVEIPSLEVPFDDFYVMMQVLVPFIFLVVVAAFRFGGGSFGSTVKLATVLILFLVSGIEDIMYFAVNGLWPMPEELPWASHMSVRLGRVATPTDFFVVCAIHFVAIVVVLALPVDRWVQRLRAGDRAGQPSHATTSALTSG